MKNHLITSSKQLILTIVALAMPGSMPQISNKIIQVFNAFENWPMHFGMFIHLIP